MSDEKEQAKDVKGVVVEANEVTLEKQGKKCCNCCCDFRRAVVVTAWIYIVFNIIYLVTAITGIGLVTAAAVASEDDGIVDGAATVAVVTTYYAIGYAFGICFGVFQLMAALKYNVCMLSTCIVFHLLFLAYSIYFIFATNPDATTTQLVVTVIIQIICYVALWIYPIIGLVKEIKAGTMSEETYAREAYSCCCAPKVETV